jgi:hypothetical protein
MISDDELKDGMPFLLQLRDASGTNSQWLETLHGDLAMHWYDIYRFSNWEALRMEAAGVFQHPLTEVEMQDFYKTKARCISISTPSVKVEELRTGTAYGVV